MYNLPYFKAENDKEVFEFMYHHPFITLTGVNSSNQPIATHIPILLDKRQDKLFLSGHIMKNTDYHKAFNQNENILAIFTGPQTYVSASWYKDQKQASTWNYQAVHAKGKLKFLNEESLMDILIRTTAHFENNPSSPSLVKHLSTDYVGRLIKAIIAFEIEVTEIAHVFKLSQNRDRESYQHIIEHLQKGDENAQSIAELMEKNKKP